MGYMRGYFEYHAQELGYVYQLWDIWMKFTRSVIRFVLWTGQPMPEQEWCAWVGERETSEKAIIIGEQKMHTCIQDSAGLGNCLDWL